jgi:hypothetical protein
MSSATSLRWSIRVRARLRRCSADSRPSAVASLRDLVDRDKNQTMDIVGERRGQANLILLRVATHDDDPGVQPVVHIWTSHNVPWLRYGGAIRTYPDLAPGR